MKVTIINKTTNTVIIGVDFKFIKKWFDLGFEIKSFESDKIKVLNAG